MHLVDNLPPRRGRERCAQRALLPLWGNTSSVTACAVPPSPEGKACALRALSSHRGDTYIQLNNNLSF